MFRLKIILYSATNTVYVYATHIIRIVYSVCNSSTATCVRGPHCSVVVTLGWPCFCLFGDDGIHRLETRQDVQMSKIFNTKASIHAYKETHTYTHIMS